MVSSLASFPGRVAVGAASRKPQRLTWNLQARKSVLHGREERVQRVSLTRQDAAVRIELFFETYRWSSGK
jgi:hypothetical protein